MITPSLFFTSFILLYILGVHAAPTLSPAHDNLSLTYGSTLESSTTQIARRAPTLGNLLAMGRDVTHYRGGEPTSEHSRRSDIWRAGAGKAVTWIRQAFRRLMEYLGKWIPSAKKAADQAKPKEFTSIAGISFEKVGGKVKVVETGPGEKILVDHIAH